MSIRARFFKVFAHTPRASQLQRSAAKWAALMTSALHPVASPSGVVPTTKVSPPTTVKRCARTCSLS